MKRPVVGIGDVDEEGVVAFGDGDVADHEVSIGVQGGGGVGSGAPDGIVRIVADEAVFGEDFAFAAFDAGRGVGDGDLVAADACGRFGGRALGRPPCWAKRAVEAKRRPAQTMRRFMV